MDGADASDEGLDMDGPVDDESLFGPSDPLRWGPRPYVDPKKYIIEIFPGERCIFIAGAMVLLQMGLYIRTKRL